MPKAQPRTAAAPATLQAVLAETFIESADCLVRLDALWLSAKSEKNHRLCLLIAAIAVNHLHHAWSSFAGLDTWLSRLAQDLSEEAAVTDAADKVRIHCAAMFAHHLSNTPFADALSIALRLKAAIALLTEHGAALPPNELFSAARSLLDFIEIENAPDGFEAILMLLEARKEDPDLNPLWRGRALVYGGRCYLRFNLAQKSKRFRERALKLWKEAHELARTHNLRTVQFDVAYAELLDAATRGEFDAVPLLLADMEASLDARRPMQLSEFFVQRTKQALVEADVQTALSASADSLRYAGLACAPEKQIGAQVLGRAWALAIDGQYAAARERIAANIAAQSGRPREIILCISAFLGALEVREAEGPEGADYVQRLREAFTQAARLQWPNYLASLPTLASRVSGDALNAGIECAFVRATVAQRKLPPPALDCAAWPWPLEITTFGGFALKRFGEPMPFEGKVQKKPLELLKSIVSVGRRGISIHLLCEMLWPDSEAGQARTAFKVTLSRLRKLLDVANVFEMTDTRVALNNEMVRVDCARFEALGDALDAADTAPLSRTTVNVANTGASSLVQQFIAVYAGRFLGNEPANRWLQSARERWHARFVRVVIDAGARIEAEGNIDVAISLYERAVEHDTVSEDLHRSLIAAYMRQGEHAQAISVFRRLRHNLSLTLGVMPSDKTLALVATLNTANEKTGTSIPPAATRRLSS